MKRSDSKTYLLDEYVSNMNGVSSRSKMKGISSTTVILGSGFLVAILILGFVSYAKDLDDNSSLQLVIMFHRHGDRAPSRLYKNDPYGDWKKYWPVGLGQLTLRGLQQMYDLGATLRLHYLSFISRYTAYTVKVKSGDDDRCLMSAGAFLAAMFPPEENQTWNKDLNWQPIPVHSVPKKGDKLFSIHVPCPRHKMEYDKVMASFIRNETKSDKELYSYLSEKTGIPITDSCEIEAIYKVLEIQEDNNLILPEWTADVYPNRLKEKATLCTDIFTYTTLMKRLRGGNMVNEIVQHLVSKSKNKLNDMKLYIYSGHSSMMMAVWRALGFEEHIRLEFSASFMFELHKISNEYFVKMLFLNNTLMAKPYELQIPNCHKPCPIEMLVNVTEPIRPVNWEEECEVEP